VIEGPLERVGLGVFVTLHGYASLAASDSLPPEVRAQGLDALIGFVLRACAPQ
jgi:hypothetical protein